MVLRMFPEAPDSSCSGSSVKSETRSAELTAADASNGFISR